MPTITDINSSSFWEQKSSLFGLLNYSITTAEKRLAAITGGRDTISANSGYMVFDTLLNGTLVERMRVTSAGKVGIGTTNPAWNLDVVGDINASGALRLNGAALSTAGNFWVAGSGGAIYYNGGNVGIGTASPTSLLDVTQSVANGRANITFLNAGAAAVNQSKMRIRLAPSTGFNNVTYIDYAPYIEANVETVGQVSGLCLGTYNGAGPLEVMRLTGTGNVGIGTTNPQVLLDLPNMSGSNSSLRIGSMEVQPLALNNAVFSDNLYFNGSNWTYRNSGYGSILNQFQGSVIFYTAPSGTAAGTAAIVEQFRIGTAGLIKIVNLPTV